jgi:hypothetical protein
MNSQSTWLESWVLLNPKHPTLDNTIVFQCLEAYVCEREVDASFFSRTDPYDHKLQNKLTSQQTTSSNLEAPAPTQSLISNFFRRLPSTGMPQQSLVLRANKGSPFSQAFVPRARERHQLAKKSTLFSSVSEFIFSCKEMFCNEGVRNTHDLKAA